jgi:anti-anti-sigma factor
MKIAITTENSRTLATLTGRLDTTNSLDFEKEMTPLLETDHPDIVVECSNFDYISSSGLRIFLRLQQKAGAKGGRLTLRNLKPEIRDIFNMTGFSAIFTIE